jgi:hypothetical protein
MAGNLTHHKEPLNLRRLYPIKKCIIIILMIFPTDYHFFPDFE